MATPIEHHEVDLRSKKARDVFRSGDVHALIHMGVMHDPRASAAELYSWNVGGTSHLLEYAQAYGVKKVVVLSSANVYGPRPDNTQFLSEDAPLMAAHFGQVSLVSLPANLVVAPVVALMMWLGMLATAVAQVDPALAAPLNVAGAPLIGFMDHVAEVAAGVPHAVWRSPSGRTWPASALSPKSATLRLPASSRSRFSGLRSRWYTPRPWQKSTAETSWRK